MKTISLISQKGGSGKTTVAVHLAVCSELQGKKSAIIDLDPQGSASEWHSRRVSQTPEVIRATPQHLPDLLRQAKDNGASLVIIDTAPHSDRTATRAASSSDIILVPVRPYVFDIAAVRSTLHLLGLASVSGRTSILFNAVPLRGGFIDEAEGVLSAAASIVPVRLHQRVAHAHAINKGKGVGEHEPGGKAAKEIHALYQWLARRKVR